MVKGSLDIGEFINPKLRFSIIDKPNLMFVKNKYLTNKDLLSRLQSGRG